MNDFTRTTTREERLESVLHLLLDCIDYTKRACSPTEMVGACLPKHVLDMAHEALQKEPV